MSKRSPQLKPPLPEEDIPRLFKEGQDQLFSGLFLHAHRIQHNPEATTLGAILLQALGMELLLKCLLAIERRQWAATHDLLFLCRLLSPESQDGIRRLAAPLLAKDAPRVMAWLRSAGHQPMPADLTFDFALQSSAEAFLKFRYLWSPRAPTDEQRFWAGGAIPNAVRFFVLEKRPELAGISPGDVWRGPF